MKTVVILLAFASVSYSQQQVWIQQGNPYDQMRIQNYLLDKGVPPEQINPPIGYSHGVLRYKELPTLPPTPPTNLRGPAFPAKSTDNSWQGWLLLSAVVAATVGPKHGHRRLTSFTAGLLLGPIGILLVTSRFTLQKPTTGLSRIVSAKVIK